MILCDWWQNRASNKICLLHVVEAQKCSNLETSRITVHMKLYSSVICFRLISWCPKYNNKASQADFGIDRWLFTHNHQDDSQEQTQEQMTGHLSICDLLELLHLDQQAVCGLAPVLALTWGWQYNTDHRILLVPQRLCDCVCSACPWALNVF